MPSARRGRPRPLSPRCCSPRRVSSALLWFGLWLPALQSVRRLKSWGFNTLAEYSSDFALPISTDSSWGTPDNAIPLKLPFIFMIRPSTYALTNVTLPYVLQLAKKGFERAVRENAGLAQGVNIRQGRVTNPAVAETFGLEYVAA